MLPLHHDEINVQLLTGVVQNQYWGPMSVYHGTFYL
nr:MAG TPA: hypothetical protein [Caudoviricetes sp.]